ncbi:cytochrome P450-like protein [Fragilaria crotonensis]|nr:cytochrome P450-like protein [Fragilaria crotonensis]
MLFVVYIAGAILLAVYLLLLRPRRGGKNAPPLVLSSPMGPLAMALEFGKGPVNMITRCYKAYGSVFTIPLGPKRLTMLIGPEAQEVFCKASDDVLSQNAVYSFMTAVFGPGVVYDASRRNRQSQFQCVTQGLRVTTLKQHVAKIERETKLYLKEHFVGDSGEIDLFHALSELTILTASRTLHGDDVREYLFKEVSELYHDLDQGLTPLTVFWPHAPTKEHRRRDKARAEMVKLFSKVIDDRRANPGKTDGTDMLGSFMDLQYKDGTKITKEEVTGLLIALLFAGQHTSCITSTWTSLFIANDPSIMNRILAEQDKILGRGDEVTYDHLSDMQLLHDCMREALRLCPPLIMLIRLAMVDVPVHTKEGKDYLIPKGDMVAISPSVGMRLPEVFPDPDKFDPDRYGEGREEHKIPFAYMGFGGGMHSCMGQNFAFVQVKTILSVLFREFEIERVAPKMPEIDYEAMVVGPKGDCTVRYKRRSKA